MVHTNGWLDFRKIGTGTPLQPLINTGWQNKKEVCVVTSLVMMTWNG
jgi:hypothetical protein